GLRRDLVGIGNGDAAPIAADVPAMKRAAHAIALYGPPVTEVGAEVRAVSVEDARHAVFRTESDQVPAEIRQRRHLSGLQLVSVGHLIPAARKRRERETANAALVEVLAHLRCVSSEDRRR